MEEKTLQEFNHSFGLAKVTGKICCLCDYCEVEFIRTKRNILAGRKFIDKESCGCKECTQKKREESTMLIHGVKNAGGSVDSISKARQTTLEKYGVENAMHSPVFLEKLKKTNLERYGVENFLETTECQDALKSYCEKNDCTSPFQLEEVKQKSIKSCMEKYGVTHASKSIPIKIKKKKTCLERYGTDNPMKNQIVKDKLTSTFLELYGVEHPLQNSEILTKMHDTMVERWGAAFALHNKELKDKQQKTNLEKYGGLSPQNSLEVREKTTQTCQEKYGHNSYLSSKEFRKKYEEWCLKNHGVKNMFHLPQYGTYGKTQEEITNWLNSYGMDFKSNRAVLDGKEIDLYSEKLNLGIEYCGLYWHNEMSPQPRDKNYHYKKYLTCKSKGIKLITVFEDEWIFQKEQCRNILLSCTGIFSMRTSARKCLVKEIDIKDFRVLCESHHLLGSNKLGIKSWVIVHDGKIIGGLSLGRHHRNTNALVLDRLFFVAGTQVVGGASRLLDKAKKWSLMQGYKNIISWSDNRWSDGNVYTKLGFLLEDELLPDYSYVDIKKPYQRISKQSQQKKKTGCPANTTEKEWSVQRGLARIWDCGKKRWAFSL
jgi:hypothetical protein